MKNYILKNCRAFDKHNMVLDGDKWNFVVWIWDEANKKHDRIDFDSVPHHAAKLASTFDAEFVSGWDALRLGLLKSQRASA